MHEIIKRVDLIIEQNDVGTGALNFYELLKTLKLALNKLLSGPDEVAMGNKAEDRVRLDGSQEILDCL